MKNRIHRFLRATAIATLIAYLPTSMDLSYAASGAIPLEVAVPSSFKLEQNLALGLPAELGRMESFRPGSKGTILHIQTAHGHYEAQEKIEKLLGWFSEKFGNFPILLEGAADQLDPSRLEFFPGQPEANLQNARWLAKKSLVTGPELFLLRNKNAKGIGVESEDAYRKNHGQFARVLKAKKEAELFSEAFKLQMEKKAAVFAPELRAFLKRLEQGALGIVPLDVWLPELRRTALKHLNLDFNDVAWQVRWPMMVRFFKIQSISQEFNSEKFESEKKAFLIQIQKHLPASGSQSNGLYGQVELLLNSMGRSVQLPEPETENAFTEMLRFLPSDFDFEPYHEVGKWIALLVLQSQIDFSVLAEEISRLESLIAEKLARGEDEKNLLKIFADYRLLEKLLALQLTPSDFDKVSVESAPRIKPSMLAKLLSFSVPHLTELDFVFDEAVSFYRGAKLRDAAMIQRTAEYFKQHHPKFAVLVTGGFHSKPMREHFEKAGYAYGVVTPAITGLDEAGYQAYLKAMLTTAVSQPTASNQMIELALGSGPRLGEATQLKRAALTVRRVRAGKDLEGWRAARSSTPIIAAVAMARSETREAVLKRDGVFEIIESPDLRLRLRASEFLFGSTRWGQVTTGTLRFQIEQFQDERWVALSPTDENEQEIVVSTASGAQPAVIRLFSPMAWSKEHRSFSVLIEGDQRIPMRIFENQKNAIRQHVVSLSNIQEDAANSSVAVSGDQFEVSEILADAIEVVSGQANRSETDPDAKPNDYDFAFRQLSDYRDQFSVANDLISDVRRWEQSEDDVQKLMSRVVSQALGRSQRSEARGTGVFPWKAVLATASATLSASAFMANALSEVYYQTVIQPAQKMLEGEIERPEILEMLMPISGQFLALMVFVLLPRMLQKTIIYYSAWFAAGWFVYGQSDWGAPAFGLVGIGVGVAFHAAYVASQSNRSEAREWKNPKSQKIVVVGTGFVGATKAVLAATDYGHDVVGVEASPEKREKLARGEPTFTAKYFPELLKQAVDSGKLNFTSNSPEDLAVALLGREIVYLALPTPQSESGEADIRFLKDAVRQIANAVKPGERKILIGKSTAPPKMTVDVLRAVVNEVLAERRERGEDIQNTDIQFAWEPEFLREGAEVEDDRELSARIVIGAETPEVAARVKAVYENFNPNLNPPRKQLKIITTDLVSAPLVKYAANGWRGTKISFINYISWLTEELGFDIDEVANAIGEDSRVVRSFLNCGLGFGGSCFPKDLAAFVKMAKDLDVSPGIVLDALAVNQVQVDRFVSQMINELDGVSGKKIVILGGAFKPETSDTREARSIIVARELLAKGANIIVVDPDQGAIRELERELQGYGARLKFYTSLEKQAEIFSGASAIALVTEWKEFKSISFDQIRRLFERGVELPKVFDGRNALNGNQLRDLGFKYFDLGRGEEDVEMVDKRKFINAVTLLFLALRISYMNTLAEMAEKLGANIHDVKQGFGYDPVVSNAAKGGEIEYLNPGLGWGGYHLPRAVDFMADLSGQAELFATLNQFDAARNAILEKFGISKDALENTRVPFVDTAKAINQRQIQVAVEKMKRELDRSSLAGVKIAVAGLAHKQGENIDSSPSIALIQALAAEGAEIHAWDPDEGVRTSVNHLLKKTSTAQQVHYFGDLHEAMRTTEMQVIAYVSPEFLNKPEKLVRDAAGQVTASFIFDARHIFVNPAVFSQFGVNYAAVGMPTLRSESRIGSESAKLRVSEISDSLSLMGWTRFSDFRIKGGVGGPFTVQLVSRKIKSVDEKVLAEQLQTRLNILRTMGKISVTSQGDALAVAANRSEARSLELITPAVFWAGVSAFAFGVSASPVIIGVTGVWALLNLALILRPYFLSFNNRVKEKTFFQKYGRTNFGYEPEGALSHFEGGAEDYKGFIYGMTPVLVGAIAAILFFPVIGFASLVLGTAVALGTVLIELMFENVVSTLLRIFVYQTIENIADIVRFYAHEPKIRSAANAVIRRFAERHILPEGGILAVLGNPTPEYPRQVVELIKKMNPQAVLIVGNGGLDKDGNQIKKPEYENIREKVLEILAQENLADHWKDKIFVSEKDKSMNTGQNVGVVAEILARERAAFEARGISLKRMVLTQMPAGMLLSRRIFEYQWASNAKAVKIEDVQPQFISYAAAQPEMSEGAPVSEETEDLLRFIVLGPQGDGKGQVWRLNEWHQGKKPLIRFHAEDHLPAETLEVVRQFLARSEARSGLDPLVLTISTPYAFGVPIFFAGVWDGKNLHIILDDQRPEHERYLFDRKKLERNAQAGKLPEGYQQIPAKFKGADVLLNLEVQTPADFFNDEEIQRELEAKVLEAMRAVLRSESRGNTPFPENLTPFALLQSMTDRALVAAQKAKKASKITAIMTASEKVLAAMKKEFDSFGPEDRQAWDRYFESYGYEAVFYNLVESIYAYAAVFHSQAGEGVSAPLPDDTGLAVRKLLRREFETFLKNPGQTNLNLLQRLQAAMTRQVSMEQLLVSALLEAGLLGAIAEMGFAGLGGDMPISIEVLPLDGDDDGLFWGGNGRSEARSLSAEDVVAVQAAFREKIQIGETVLNNGLAGLLEDGEKSLQIHDGEVLHPEAKNVHPTNAYVLLNFDWNKVWPAVEKLTDGQATWKAVEAVLTPHLQSALEKFGAGDARWLIEHRQDDRYTKSVVILFKARSEVRLYDVASAREALTKIKDHNDVPSAIRGQAGRYLGSLGVSGGRRGSAVPRYVGDFLRQTQSAYPQVFHSEARMNKAQLFDEIARMMNLTFITQGNAPRTFNLFVDEVRVGEIEGVQLSDLLDDGWADFESKLDRQLGYLFKDADEIHISVSNSAGTNSIYMTRRSEVRVGELRTGGVLALNLLDEPSQAMSLSEVEHAIRDMLTNNSSIKALAYPNVMQSDDAVSLGAFDPDYLRQHFPWIEAIYSADDENQSGKINALVALLKQQLLKKFREGQKFRIRRASFKKTDADNTHLMVLVVPHFGSEAMGVPALLRAPLPEIVGTEVLVEEREQRSEAREMNPIEVFKDQLALERKNNSGIWLSKSFAGLVGIVVGGILFAALGLGSMAIVGVGLGGIAGFFGIALVYGDVLDTKYFDNLEKILDESVNPDRINLLRAKQIEIETGAYQSLVPSPLNDVALDAIEYALSRSEARNFRAETWSYEKGNVLVVVSPADLEALNELFMARIPADYVVDGKLIFKFDLYQPYQIRSVQAPVGSNRQDIDVGDLNLSFKPTVPTEGIFYFEPLTISAPWVVGGSSIAPQTLQALYEARDTRGFKLDRVVIVRQSPTIPEQTIEIEVPIPPSLTVSPAAFLDTWFEQKNAGLSFEKSVERKLIKKITFVGVGVAASPAARGVDLPSPDYLNLFSQSYVEQVAKGVSGEEGGLAAVVSYVPEPTGKEKGLFYAVDFGGTNFRVMAVRLKGDGRYEIVGTPLKVKLPSDLMKGPSRNLFAFFAEKFKTHFSDIQKQGLIRTGEEAIRIGFTYSYPAKLNGRVDSATAIALSKNLQSPDLVGQDVALLFQEALDFQFEQQSEKPQVVAVANDTVGTAVVGKLQNPLSIAGLILGTGRNLARKIQTAMLRGLNLERFGQWIYLNDESGLNTHVPESESVISKTDKKLFELYKHLGSDIYQKMTSGMYIPELIRLRFLEAAEQGLIFQSGIPYYLGSAWNEEDLVPEGLLAIFSDMTLASELQDYPATAKALAKLGVNLPTQEEVKLFYSTVVGFYRRSAYLSASEIMGTALFYSPELNEEVVVSIDGSLFEKVPAYKDWIETALADIAEVHFGDRAKAKNIQLELVKDGSGVGAAMIAAIVTARSEQRVAPANADQVVVPAELPYRQTLEAARLKLLNWLGDIVPQRWLSAIGFTDAARQVRAFTGNEAFAEEIPAEQQSVLDQNPGAQWMFNQNETVAAGLAQTLIHPSLMEAILKSGDGRAAFELLNQFASDAETDLSPLVAFVFDGDLKADLRKLMNAKKSGLTPTERLRIEPLLGLLQIQQSATDSVERAMNAYIQQHRSSRGIAVLLPDQSLLTQIHGALALALGKVVSGRDTIALARLARVLQQASLLEKEAQDLFLQRELPGITGKNGKWTHSAIQALLEQWIANHELVAISA